MFAALPATLAISTQAASACDLNHHCYGMVSGYPNSGLDGVAAYIQPNCLSAATGNMVTDEIWLVDAHSSTVMWVEAGFLAEGANVSINGIPGAGTYTFWGEKDPYTGYQFVGHVLAYSPALSNTYTTIYRTGSTSFNAYVGVWGGTSTNNVISPNRNDVGSETSGNAHSYGTWTGVQYRTSGTWHSGVVNYTTPNPTAPETFSWISQSTSFHAGVSC